MFQSLFSWIIHRHNGEAIHTWGSNQWFQSLFSWIIHRHVLCGALPYGIHGGFNPCSLGSFTVTRCYDSFGSFLLRVSILVLLDHSPSLPSNAATCPLQHGFNPCSLGSFTVTFWYLSAY